MFSIFFPWKGALTLTPGMGVGGSGGHLGPPKSPKISQHHKKSQKNSSYENCSHFWDIFQKLKNKIFKISSYIQKITPNPINALKITIINTKTHPKYKCTNTYFKNYKNPENLKITKVQTFILLYIKFP